MELLKFATEWAKAEVFSARFFILFALMFLIASLGFWQLGKTEMAKAFIIPTLVAGALLMAVGVGILFTNKARVTSFTEAYNTNPTEFVKSEIARTEQSMSEYKTIVFKVIPVIIAVAALMIVFALRSDSDIRLPPPFSPACDGAGPVRYIPKAARAP